MSRSSDSRGRGGHDLYIYRPVLGEKTLRPLQKRIGELLVDPFAFQGTNPNGHVTLLGRAKILKAMAMSRYLGALTPAVIRNQLLAGLPETHEQDIPARVTDIRTIGAHVVLSLDNRDLEAERQAELERLMCLGGRIRLKPPEDPCHVTIGLVDTPLPKSVIDEVTAITPSSLQIGRVLPRPVPADERIGQFRLRLAT